METWQLISLTLLGVIAGVLNVIAGGGSLLTLPAMVLMGFEAPVANGTNRVAILAQNVSATTGFRRKGYSDIRLSLSLALATIPGALAGAMIGAAVRGVLFNRILAVIMIVILVHIMLKGRRKPDPSASSETGATPARRRRILGHLCMIGIGFYGGFIQAGVGFLLMAALHNVMGLDLVRVNMHKVFIVGAFTAVALSVYIWTGNVLWIPGLALALGNASGGWIGSHLSVTRGDSFIRKVLVVTLAAMAVRLLFLK
jgi:uncharacterized membrane protein YfcA